MLLKELVLLWGALSVLAACWSKEGKLRKLIEQTLRSLVIGLTFDHLLRL